MVLWTVGGVGETTCCSLNTDLQENGCFSAETTEMSTKVQR